MDRFSKSATMLPQKAVDEFKALMEADGVQLSEDEAREQEGQVLIVMKRVLVRIDPSVAIDKTDLTL